MRTITATGRIDLPAKTSYRPPKPKRTGLDWAPIVNQRVWDEAAGIVVCTWNGCTRNVTTGQHCARHANAIEAEKRRAQADREHPPCATCGGMVTRRKWESYNQHRKRRHCSAQCGYTPSGGARTCTHCGTTLPPGHKRRTCSDHCASIRMYNGKSAAGRTRWDGTTPSKTKRTGCDIDGCERPHRAKGLCSRHYDVARRVALEAAA